MPEEKKEEKSEDRPRLGPITEIQLYRDGRSVRFTGSDAAGNKLSDDKSRERFQTVAAAKQALHARYPEAHIR